MAEPSSVTPSCREDGRAYCSWSSSAGYFSCAIAVPHGIKAGQKNPYKITAAEMPGTSFLNAPVRGKTLNPETIYFG